jgi:hypothetical protein
MRRFWWALGWVAAVACADGGSPPSNTITSDAATARDSRDVAGPATADGAPAPTDAAGAASLPCDVAAVLAARCSSCHAQPPRFGAPFSLLTWADTRASSSSGPTPIWSLMKNAIEAGDMPPPSSPTGPLTASERATLLGWLTAGAPSGSAACGAAPDAGADVSPATGPSALPCQPQHQFRAHGATNDAPFQVPAENDAYRCFNFQVPFSAIEQGTAWAPIIDDQRVVHHWILYAQTGTFRATGCQQAGRTFLMGWAPGAGNTEMPADVGLELPDPGKGWLSLEVHYNNPARLGDARDRSGVALCTTQTPRPKLAGVISVGSTRLLLPIDARDQEVVGECPAQATALLPEPLHVLSAAPHMHRLGKSVRSVIVRGTETLPLVDVPRWSFDNQRSYPTDPATTIVRPGDTIRTTCVYDNNTGRVVRFGERTEDEMCLNFILAYPIDRVPIRACGL